MEGALSEETWEGGKQDKAGSAQADVVSEVGPAHDPVGSPGAWTVPQMTLLPSSKQARLVYHTRATLELSIIM